MTNFYTKNRGESLTEVLVAVGILVVVLVTTFILINRGIATNISVKNKILAINIAREGIEGMRNIRDTNWLKYSGDRRNKWLCIDSFSTSTGNPDTIINCPSGQKIDDSSYILNFNKDLSRFFIKEATETSKLDLKTSTNFSEYKLYKDVADSRYTHKSSGNSATIFYRQLILKAEPEPNCGISPCMENTRLHVISRVQWIEPLIAGDENASQSDLIGTIVMETYLYDYLDREEY